MKRSREKSYFSNKNMSKDKCEKCGKSTKGTPYTLCSICLEKLKQEETKMKWIRLSEQVPPVNTDILILVNGEIHEGYLDSVLLMVKPDEPTLFETLYTNSENYGCGSPQHSSWGDDPYWMPIPCKKPIQIKSTKPKYELWGKNDPST